MQRDLSFLSRTCNTLCIMEGITAVCEQLAHDSKIGRYQTHNLSIANPKPYITLLHYQTQAVEQESHLLQHWQTCFRSVSYTHLTLPTIYSV